MSQPLAGMPPFWLKPPFVLLVVAVERSLFPAACWVDVDFVCNFVASCFDWGHALEAKPADVLSG